MAIGVAAVMGTTLDHSHAQAMTEKVLEDVGMQMPRQMQVPASRSPSPTPSVDEAFQAADQALAAIEDFEQENYYAAPYSSEDDCSDAEDSMDGSFN